MCWKKLPPNLIALAGIFICQALPAQQQEDAAASLSRSFRCPEELTNEAKLVALREFLQAYAKLFPDKTVRDLMVFRSGSSPTTPAPRH